MIKLTVVICCHNYACYLTELFDSVLEQKMLIDEFDERVEVYFVDDGSTDESAEVAGRYIDALNLRLFRLSSVGLAAASNHAIGASESSSWIMRLDADDLIAKGSLVNILQWISIATVDEVFVPDIAMFSDANKAQFTEFYQSEWESGIYGDFTPYGSGIIFHKSLWSRVGGYNESLRFQDDFEFWMRLSQVAKVKKRSVVTYLYRQHELSMSSNYYQRALARADVKRALAGTRIESIKVAWIIDDLVSPDHRKIEDFHFIETTMSLIKESGLVRGSVFLRSNQGIHSFEDESLFPLKGFGSGRYLDEGALRGNGFDLAIIIDRAFSSMYPFRLMELVDTLLAFNCSCAFSVASRYSVRAHAPSRHHFEAVQIEGLFGRNLLVKTDKKWFVNISREELSLQKGLLL